MRKREVVRVEYKSYDALPLFLNAATGAPGKAQRCGFAGERRSSGMTEPRGLRRGEGYGACDDEAKVLGVSPSSGYELMLVVTKFAPFHPACLPGIHFAPLFLLSPNKRFAFAWGPRFGFPVLRRTKEKGA